MFRRGFKTWCENTSISVHKRLNIQPNDPIDPHALAAELGISVCSPGDLPGLSEVDLRILLSESKDSWSAATVSVGAASLIILNSSHAPTRRASDLTHEIAHILLGHEPGRVDVTEDGLMVLNTYDTNQEDEANWLAGCLLLPRDALLRVRRDALDDAAIARRYGVSLDMLKFRLNVTGVDRQVQRAVGKYY